MKNIFTTSRTLLLLVALGLSGTAMAQNDYFWVGDGGDWSDVSHWASSSGGSGSAYTTPPTSSDNVYFDKKSFTEDGQTVAIDVFAKCGSLLDTAAFNHSFDFQNELSIYGDFYMDNKAGISSQSASINLLGVHKHKLHLEPSLSTALDIAIAGTGSYTLSNELSVRNLFLDLGGFASEGYAVNLNLLDLYEGTEVDLSSSIIQLSSIFFTGDVESIDFASEGSSIFIVDNEVSTSAIDPQGLEFNEIIIWADCRIESDFSANIVVMLNEGVGKDSPEISFDAGVEVTAFEDITIFGTSESPVTLSSVDDENPGKLDVTIDNTNDFIYIEYADLSNITYLGDEAAIAENSVDGGGNENILFPAIDFPELEAKTYGGASFELGATTNLGREITYASSDEGVATVDAAGLVTIIGAGSSTLTLSSPGVFDVVKELVVNKASLRVTVDADQSKAYGADVPELTFSYNADDFVLGEDETEIDTPPVFTTDATQASPVGEYAVMLSDGEDDNYTFVYEDGMLKVTQVPLDVSADNKSVTYGDAVPQLTITYQGFVLDDDELDLDVMPVISTEAIQGSNVGSYPITFTTNAVDANYAIEHQSGTLTITQASQEVTWDVLSDVDLINGTTTVDLTGAAESSSGLEVTITVVSGPATIEGNTLTLTGDRGTVELHAEAGNQNYASASASASFEVMDSRKQTQTITFAALNPVTFGDETFTLSATASSNLEVRYESSDESVAAINDNIVTIIGTGTTLITAYQDGNEDFHNAPSVSQELVVNKATPIITFESIDPVSIDQGPLTLTASVNSGQEIIFTSSDETVATIDENVVTLISAGTTSITANVTESDNYLSSSASQDLTVEEVPLSFEENRSLLIYPNPTSDYLNIEGKYESLKLLDLQGRMIGEGITGDRIELIGLPAGVYILEYVDLSDKSHKIRFIKSAD